MTAPTPRLPLAIAAGMFLTAATVLVLQIALTRLLSASVQYHYAFVVLAVVMLAMAASSVTAFRHRVEGRADARIGVAAALAGLSLSGATLAYVRWGASAPGGQPLLVAIGGFYVVFWLGGYVVSALLDRHQEVVGRLYWADLAGAGAGCVAAVPLLDRWSAQDVLLLGGAAFAAAGVLIGAVHGDRRARSVSWVALGVTAALALAAQRTDVSRLRFAKAEDLSLVLWERWNSLARVTIAREQGGLQEMPSVADPAQRAALERQRRLWQAGWGMSGRYAGEVPELRWITLDAGAGTQIVQDGYRRAVAGALPFLEWDVTSAGHHLRRDALARTLVIGGGGGRDVLTALQFGAQAVDVIELNPLVVAAVEEAVGDFSGGIYHQPRVSLTLGEGRSVLSRRSQRYDLVQMSMVDTFAASASGALTLSESGIYTREAFEQLFSTLDDDGILSISRWLSPDYWGESARTVTMLADALRRQGVDDPAAHLALLSVEGYLQVGVSTALVSRRPFTAAERDALAKLAEEKGYTLRWPAPAAVATIGPFAVETLLRADPATLVDPVYDLTPATDERPFFFSFKRPFSSWWAALRAGDGSLGSEATVQFFWTGLVLCLVALAGVWMPLRRLSARLPSAAPSVAAVAYFGGIGFGFMLAEIALVQRFMVFLGHPTRGLSVVLASLLLASGVGSLTSTWVRDADLVAAVRRRVVGIVVLLAGAAIALPPALAAGIGLSDGMRVAIAVACVSPVGAALGVCVPLGVRLLGRGGQADWVPVLWGVNGLLGVAGSIVGMTLATTWGYTPVLGLAALAYLAVGASAGRLAGPVASR
jgi:hypothetical protein